MEANNLRGHLDLILLATLQNEPLYGVRIIQDANTRTEGYFQFKEGTLYPALHRLEKQGLIQGEFRANSNGGPPRKYYKLTSKGQQELDRKQRDWQAFTRAMQPYGGE